MKIYKTVFCEKWSKFEDTEGFGESEYGLIYEEKLVTAIQKAPNLGAVRAV